MVFVEVGDLVYLAPTDLGVSDQPYYLSSDGIMSFTVVASDQGAENGFHHTSIWRIHPQRSHTAKKAMTSLLAKTGITMGDAHADARFADALDALRAEEKAHQVEMKKSQGRTLRYGMIVELANYTSQQFLFVAQRSGGGRREGKSVMVTHDPGERAWFKVLPALRQHVEGTPVHAGDVVVLFNVYSGRQLRVDQECPADEHGLQVLGDRATGTGFMMASCVSNSYAEQHKGHIMTGTPLVFTEPNEDRTLEGRFRGSEPSVLAAPLTEYQSGGKMAGTQVCCSGVAETCPLQRALPCPCVLLAAASMWMLESANSLHSEAITSRTRFYVRHVISGWVLALAHDDDGSSAPMTPRQMSLSRRHDGGHHDAHGGHSREAIRATLVPCTALAPADERALFFAEPQYEEDIAEGGGYIRSDQHFWLRNDSEHVWCRLGSADVDGSHVDVTILLVAPDPQHSKAVFSKQRSAKHVLLCARVSHDEYIDVIKVLTYKRTLESFLAACERAAHDRSLMQECRPHRSA